MGRRFAQRRGDSADALVLRRVRALLMGCGMMRI